jgi:uncharacterized protein with GYD domain
VRNRQVNVTIGDTYVGVAVVVLVIGQLDVVPLIVVEAPRHGACAIVALRVEKECSNDAAAGASC